MISLPDSPNVCSYGLENEGCRPDIAELTGRSAAPAEAVAEVRHHLGSGAPRRRFREGLSEHISPSDVCNWHHNAALGTPAECTICTKITGHAVRMMLVRRQRVLPDGSPEDCQVPGSLTDQPERTLRSLFS